MDQVLGSHVRLLMSLVDLGEVHDRMIRLAGVDNADERLVLRKLPIEIVPVREPLVTPDARREAVQALDDARPAPPRTISGSSTGWTPRTGW